MSKLHVVFALFVVASAVPYAHGQSTRTQNRVTVAASASSRGGRATAVARGTSRAFADAESDMVRYYRVVFDKANRFPHPGHPDYCRAVRAAVNENLSAVASAVARAFVRTLAKVDVDGEGDACASGEGEARAQARALASVIARAIVEAENDISYAEASGAANARISIVARAFANAAVDVCAGSDSNAVAIQTSVARAVIEAVASVTLSLLAEGNCNGRANSVVRVVSDTSVMEENFAETNSRTRSEGDADSVADGESSAMTSRDCTGVLRACCRWYAMRSDRCYCSWTSSATPRCDAIKQAGSPVMWIDSMSGTTCHC